MNHRQHGSAVLLVVLVMSSLALVALSAWRSMIFLHDIVLKKQQYEQRFRTAEAALNYGVAYCKKYPGKVFFDDATKDDPKKLKSPMTFQLSPWPNARTALVAIYPGEKKARVRARVLSKHGAPFAMRCSVGPVKEGITRISGWSIDRV